MVGDRRSVVERLEDRRVLTASLGWDGPGAGSAALTYYIGNTPDSLDQAEVATAIQTALDAWSGAADVSFTQVDQPGLRDSLDFTFGRIDGPGGVLAEAYFPDDVNSARQAGDIEFDIAESWEIGNANGRAAFDLVSIAVHEIGHALGLDHISDSASTLAPFASPNERFTGLSEADISAIQELYAPSTILVDAGSDTNTDADAENPSSGDTLQENDSSRGNFRRWGRNPDGQSPRSRGLGTPNNFFHNFVAPTDVNGDESTSPLDALLVINMLNSGRDAIDHQCDTNNDGAVSPLDALLVINSMNSDAAADAAPEADDTLGESEVDTSDSADGSTDAGGTSDDEDADESGADDTSGEDESDTGSTTDPGNADDTSEEDCPADSHLPLAAGLFSGGSRPSFQRFVDRVFESADANEDGVVTEDEVPALVWNRLQRYELDANQDGGISQEEVDAKLLELRQTRFDSVDADESGELTESEVSERRWSVLKNADTDESGGISLDELEAFRGLSRFEKLDANGDESLTEDEVSERLWERLVQKDADESGDINQEEFETRNHSHFGGRLARFANRIIRFAGRFS